LVSFLCDPYQPLETTQGDTRQVLEQLLTAGHQVRIQTRSDLVRRDFDLLARYPELVRLGTSLPHLDDNLAAVLEPKAPAPSKRLAMLRDASQRGIPVYVAVAPFMPFHPVAVLDQVIQAVLPLHPKEIFCEVLNPKGDALNMVATALAASYPVEAAQVRAYDEAAWAKWTYQVLEFGVSKYGQNGFIAWPDTGRAWARHLPPAETAFLDRFLPDRQN
jgi:DNA repair photolyase